ncbi:MAG TPA: peptide deformylase [Bacteroidota bacterium]|nr:peptide deformylase [Bacteroidota bacterium]
MAVRRIRLLGDPVLRARCAEVEDCSAPMVRKATRDLRDTLEDFRARRGFGRGIAAPQIGVRLRIIVIRTKGLGALINPRVTKWSKRTFELWDDCFSFPDILVRVRRFASVEVRYVDENGAAKKIQAAGALAELLQHEIDHIDGILAIDRALSSRHIILRSELSRSA